MFDLLHPFIQPSSLTHLQLDIERRNQDFISLPVDGLQSTGCYWPIFGKPVLINVLTDSSYPFDPRMQEGSPKPVTDPALRVFDWLDERVEQKVSQVVSPCVINNQVQITRSHVESPCSQSCTSCKIPLKTLPRDFLQCSQEYLFSRLLMDAHCLQDDLFGCTRAMPVVVIKVRDICL